MSTQNCKQCPWRTNSGPGWLGDNSPERLVLSALAGVTLPCHPSIDYEDPDWLENWEAGERGEPCRGSLIFLANNLILPRDRHLPKVKKSKDIFTKAQEFIDYHRGAPVHSWDEIEDTLGKDAWARYQTLPLATMVFADFFSGARDDEDE